MEISHNYQVKFKDVNPIPTVYFFFFLASGLGVRHVQTLLLFFGLTVAYALRVNLSVAIVAMVDKGSKNDFDHFDWNEQTKSVILSSFFWGYVVTQIPAGQLAQRVGAKVLLLFSLGICSTLAVLTPLFAHLGGDKVSWMRESIHGYIVITPFY